MKPEEAEVKELEERITGEGIESRHPNAGEDAAARAEKQTANASAHNGSAVLGVDEITDWTEVLAPVTNTMITALEAHSAALQAAQAEAGDASHTVSSSEEQSPSADAEQAQDEAMQPGTLPADEENAENAGVTQATITIDPSLTQAKTVTMTAVTPVEGSEGSAEVASEAGTVKVAKADGSEAGSEEGAVGSEEPSEGGEEESSQPGDGSEEEGSQPEEGAEEQKAEEKEEEKDPEIEAIKEKIRERKREKRRKARQRKVRFWTILILFLLALGSFLFSISGFFTVDSIEVEGNSHFTDEEIINIAHAVPGHNLIYNTDKTSIVEYLTQNPYIKSAEVTRKLPSTLVITVRERAQACVFKYDDDYLIMDDEGILLKKTRTQPKTTMVTGMVVTKIKLGEVIGTDNQAMFTRLIRLIRSMKMADMYFVKIDMTAFEEDNLVRAYIYDNLVVKADYDLLVTFLKNGRLHKVVEKLFEDGIERGTILLAEDGTASFEPGI